MKYNELLTRAEAAEYSGFHPNTIDNWVNSGALPTQMATLKVPRRVEAVSRATLDALVENWKRLYPFAATPSATYGRRHSGRPAGGTRPDAPAPIAERIVLVTVTFGVRKADVARAIGVSAHALSAWSKSDGGARLHSMTPHQANRLALLWSVAKDLRDAFPRYAVPRKRAANERTRIVAAMKGSTDQPQEYCAAIKKVLGFKG